jgi:hypothetical protein
LVMVALVMVPLVMVPLVMVALVMVPLVMVPLVTVPLVMVALVMDALVRPVQQYKNPNCFMFVKKTRYILGILIKYLEYLGLMSNSL